MAYEAPMETSRIGSVLTLRDLMVARAEDDSPAVHAGGDHWSWAEVVKESAARVAALDEYLNGDEPPHVGVLMDNTPE